MGPRMEKGVYLALWTIYSIMARIVRLWWLLRVRSLGLNCMRSTVLLEGQGVRYVLSGHTATLTCDNVSEPWSS